MLTAIATWFASKGVGLLLGYAANLALDLFKTWQANRAQRDAGRSEVEAAQAQAGAKAESVIAAEAAKPVSEDDAIETMRRGAA